MPTFWYCSVAVPAFFAVGFGFGFESSAPSRLMLSLSIGCKGFPPVFFGAGAFFWRLALGGVFESSESSSWTLGSLSEFSSSDSALALFLETGALGLRVV